MTERLDVYNPNASMEIAAVLRRLMLNPWLVAGRDDEQIATIRRHEKVIKDTFSRLGWQITIARDFVRLRKTAPPAHLSSSGLRAAAHTWMFLIAAGAERLRPLERLGAIAVAAHEAAATAGVPVTGDITERRALLAGLRELYDRGVLEEKDGNSDDYAASDDPEVLVAIHHQRLLHLIANFSLTDPLDDPHTFLSDLRRENDDMRRMRRRVLDEAVIHTIELDPDEADWLRRRAGDRDSRALAAAFALYRERREEGLAWVVPAESFRYPRELGPQVLPGVGTVAQAALDLCDLVAAGGDAVEGWTGWRQVTYAQVTEILAELAATNPAWAAEDAANPHLLASKIKALLVPLNLLHVDGTWKFSPATGRWKSRPAPPRARTERAPIDRTASDQPQETLL
ncbi:hypothetical protein CTKZ_08410 [Cellulomonas algicola]|uniref:TIGR02678 family protein n=1 Tax=Cellulomonas algicola TaxID=2071633 RepID=A0A401UX73_9CELL|nr:DUF2398 family protein [Cellulomonas algicola]GCD19279.1 hypothetical protein CTKZ_08410 [Cellulomonas algicola]